MNYLRSSTINDKVVFKGTQLIIKALYDKGLHNLPEVVKCQNGEE